MAIECWLFNLSICSFNFRICSRLRFFGPLILALASSECLKPNGEPSIAIFLSYLKRLILNYVVLLFGNQSK